MSGLVQKFCVESDDIQILTHSVRILQRWHNGVSHYRTGVDINGVPYLCLMWAAPDGKAGITPLIAPLKSAESIAHQIYAWLESAEYPKMPDIDGSCSKGYTATYEWEGPVIDVVKFGESMTRNVYDSSFYDFITIMPAWIEYHK